MNSSISSFKKTPLLFFVKCGLLSAVIGILYYGIGKQIDGDIVITNQRFKMKRIAQGKGCPTIIFGDSRALAMDWNGRPGLYNFSVAYFDGFYPYRYILDRYLQSNAAPQVLIFAPSPETFCEPYPFHLRDGTRRRLVDLLPLSLLWRGPPPATMSEKWRCLRSRYDVSNLLFNDLQNRLGTAGNRFNRATGALVFSQNTQLGLPIPTQQPRTFQLTPAALADFTAFLRDAQNHHIQVIVYLTPLATPVLDANKDFYQGLEATINLLARQFPNVCFCRPYPPAERWAPDFFCDVSHMNLRGAERFDRDRMPLLMNLADRLRSKRFVPDGKPIDLTK
jgi:hypothetical protein